MLCKIFNCKINIIIKINKESNNPPNNICKFKNPFEEKLFLSYLSIPLFKFQNELPLDLVIPDVWLLVSSKILFIVLTLLLLLLILFELSELFSLLEPLSSE